LGYFHSIKTERRGFEPPLGYPKADFESAAFNHSATSPRFAEGHYSKIRTAGKYWATIPRAIRQTLELDAKMKLTRRLLMIYKQFAGFSIF
jgi:hypothetical protein